MPFLIFAFIVVPLIELFVIIEIGRAIGVVPTIMLMFLSAVLGAIALRSQGRAVWARFREAVSEGRVPHREILDGVLVIFGGALLLTPGFLTDITGIALLAPPSRAGVRGLLSKLMVGRMAPGARSAYWAFGRARGGTSANRGGDGGDATSQPRPRPTGKRAYDVEGSAQEVVDERFLEAPKQPKPRSDP